MGKLGLHVACQNLETASWNISQVDSDSVIFGSSIYMNLILYQEILKIKPRDILKKNLFGFWITQENKIKYISKYVMLKNVLY